MFDLKDFNKHYTYTHDRSDKWKLLKRKPYNGDCEDYALSVLYNLKGRSLLRMFLSLIKRQSKIRYCKINNNGHAVLKYKGKYIDCNYKRWVKKETMIKANYRFHKINYLPYMVLLKLIKGKM